MLLLNSCTLETAVLLYERAQSDTFLYINEGLCFSGIQEQRWGDLCAGLGAELVRGRYVQDAFAPLSLAEPHSIIGYSQKVIHREQLSSPVAKSSIELVERPAPGDGTLQWYVPYRNPIVIAMAMSAAEARGQPLTLGHYDRRPRQADCDPERLQPMIEAIRAMSYLPGGTWRKPVSVEFPFRREKYKIILGRGVELGVPFDLVWTCHNALDRQCGICVSCLLRKNVARLYPDLAVKQPDYIW